MIDYPWSSYGSIVSLKPTRLQRMQVIKIFDTVENFKYYHTLNQDFKNIEDLLFD